MNTSLRLGVDLTPVLPGGENGGAGVWALGLVRGLAEARPDWHLELLTGSLNDEFLSQLDRSNVSRVVTDHWPESSPQKPAERPHLRRVFNALPGAVRVRLKQVFEPSLPHQPQPPHRRWDLLLCPFTAPFFWESGVPCVSLVHDLQYRDYPEFFSEQDRALRAAHFRRACDCASRLVVASSFVRDSVLTAASIKPSKVSKIPIRCDRPPSQNENRLEQIKSCGLFPGNYLIYPANLWPHKNHRMLLIALSIFHVRNPGNRLQLALTGNTLQSGERLRQEALGAGARSQGTLHWICLGWRHGQPARECTGHGLPFSL